MSEPSLWQHADFLKLWVGQTVSRLGSVVTRTALPLVALLVLGAGPFELAFLVIAQSLSVLLVGLVAGAWVDRLRRRPILIASDVARAALLFTVPLAQALGALRMEQLYAVAFLAGCLDVVFSAAYPAYVPSLIGVDRVVEGNSKLATSSAIAEVGGPGLAGALVQIISAPFAILVDALSYLVSALSVALIRTPEPARPAREASSRVIGEIAEGLRVVRGHKVVFPLAARSIIAHVSGAFYGVLYSLYLLNELHLDPFLLGIVISAGGVGSLVGSVFASRVVRAIGIGPAIVWMAAGASAIGILTPLAQGPVALATIMVFLPQLIGDGLQTIGGVAEISLVQGLVPDRILGRTNATLEVISHGVGFPIGALIAAFIAEQIGVRGAIAVGWAGMAASLLFLVFSPVPRVRTAAEYVATEAAISS
ncbi:MAG: MFS transporter [Chloroflexi bacterium]|nr:MAG: MFS transporter [Chloroflexota bacterium]TME42227.1 MAG: MFS transporter [Chloroflexota bacterium]